MENGHPLKEIRIFIDVHRIRLILEATEVLALLSDDECKPVVRVPSHVHHVRPLGKTVQGPGGHGLVHLLAETIEKLVVQVSPEFQTQFLILETGRNRTWRNTCRSIRVPVEVHVERTLILRGEEGGHEQYKEDGYQSSHIRVFGRKDSTFCITEKLP